MLRLRTVTHATVICALSAGAGAASAQQSAKPCAPQKSARHVERPSVDLFATLVAAGDSGRVPPIYLATLLQEIQLLVKAPDTIAELSTGHMSLWLHGDGRLTNPGATDSLLSQELVRALTVAIDSISRLSGIGPVPDPGPDSIPLRLFVHFADERTPFSLPLIRVALPPAFFEFQVEKPALLRPGQPAPKFPQNLREMNLEGEVLAQFVVSQAGRVEMRTFRALKSSHPDFEMAVREVLPRMRFLPAQVGGCAVRQMVQLPFAFKLNW